MPHPSPQPSNRRSSIYAVAELLVALQTSTAEEPPTVECLRVLELTYKRVARGLSRSCIGSWYRIAGSWVPGSRVQELKGEDLGIVKRRSMARVPSCRGKGGPTCCYLRAYIWVFFSALKSHIQDGQAKGVKHPRELPHAKILKPQTSTPKSPRIRHQTQRPTQEPQIRPAKLLKLAQHAVQDRLLCQKPDENSGPSPTCCVGLGLPLGFRGLGF